MERIEKQELLDCDGWSDADVACALGAIGRVNLLYGGHRMHKRLFQRVSSHFQGKKLQVLEVASGYADVLQAASLMLRKKDISMEISLLDRCAQHLPKMCNWHKDLQAPNLMTGDALAIPLADNSVDVVSCCLFFHHLSVEQARAFLREALRVARVAVLVNDVERKRMNYFLSHLYRFMDPSKLSRHDGPTSVRQAYTHAEMQELLRETGCKFEMERGYLYRLGAIAWKQEMQTE
ncbi:MAG: methyltransferase domain-containing protein [Terriglobia bacterium]|nr:methyltransferase domain-containing protein [Terriglobia bacterium]